MIYCTNSLVLLTLLFTAGQSCKVQFGTTALKTSDAQKLQTGLLCSKQLCWLTDCTAPEECCDGEDWLTLNNGLRKQGCTYECSSSMANGPKEPLGYNALVNVVASEETDDEICTDLDLTWNSVDVKVKLCASASMCDSSVEDARSIATFVYSWDCKACRTGTDGEDNYKLAPVLFDKCCEECNEIISLNGLNQPTNPNFLICNGCASQSSALRHLKGYIENDSAETGKIPLLDYIYTGDIEVNKSENGVDLPVLQMSCAATMGEVESKFDIKQIKCDRCSADLKPTCCDLCDEKTSGDSETNYVCDGCDGFESKIDELITTIHEDICKEFSDATEGNETECASMSAAASLTLSMVMLGLALSLL